ncbi:MAG: hypothetical protein AAFY60_15320, partial [Myxococcota bacterium]
MSSVREPSCEVFEQVATKGAQVPGVASMAAARRLELDAHERHHMALHILIPFVGGGLLALSWVWSWLFPGQDSVAAIVQLLAVGVVAWPVFKQAAEGFISKDPGS